AWGTPDARQQVMLVVVFYVNALWPTAVDCSMPKTFPHEQHRLGIARIDVSQEFGNKRACICFIGVAAMKDEAEVVKCHTTSCRQQEVSASQSPAIWRFVVCLVVIVCDPLAKSPQVT